MFSRHLGRLTRWKGRFFASVLTGILVWPVRWVLSKGSAQEAEALLPVEVMHPDLCQKGEQGPDRLASYVGKVRSSGRRQIRWEPLPKNGMVATQLRSMVRIMSEVLPSSGSM